MKYYGLAFIKNVFGFLFFFSIRVFFHEHWWLTGQQGKGGTIFYSALPLPPAPEHSDIYLQLCMWDDYHIFNCTACIYQTTTRWDLPPYRINIWLIDDVTLSFCLFTSWFDCSFFVTAMWDEKPVDLNSHRVSPLHYKRTD